MHGIREPKNMGGRMLLVGQHPKELRDKSGREHHLAPVVVAGGLLSAAGRFLPAAVRGFRAARAYQPWSKNLGWAKRARDILLPRGGLSAPMAARGAGAGFRTGSFLRQNPIMALSLAPQASVAGYKGAKYLTTEAAPAVGKAYVDALIPGDSIFKDKNTGEEKDPNTKRSGTKPGEGRKEGMYYTDPSKAKKLAEERKDARINNLLDIMGYDKAKKTAAYDALIDASQVVMDRGTLSKKNIGRELINPIIAAASKRFDKPEQIREAVGLLAAKGEIEKEIAQGKPGAQMKSAQDYAAMKNISLDKAYKELGFTKKGNIGETVTAVAKQYGVSGTNADVLDSSLRILEEAPPIMKIKGDNKSLKEFKEANQGKSNIELEFVDTQIQEKEPGYYIVDKRIVEVDESGNISYYY